MWFCKLFSIFCGTPYIHDSDFDPAYHYLCLLLTSLIKIHTDQTYSDGFSLHILLLAFTQQILFPLKKNRLTSPFGKYSAWCSTQWFCPGLVAGGVKGWSWQGKVLTVHHIYSETEATSAMPICLCKCLCVLTVDGHIVRMCPLALLHKTQSQRSGDTAIGTRAKEVQLLRQGEGVQFMRDLWPVLLHNSSRGTDFMFEQTKIHFYWRWKVGWEEEDHFNLSTPNALKTHIHKYTQANFIVSVLGLS